MDAETLARHLGMAGWVVVDCRNSLGDPEAGPRAYAAARIPGARYAHLDHDLAGPPSAGRGRHPLPEPRGFADALGAWGIGPETQVVAYDDSFGSIAARLWWMLRRCGHEAVALLDGGWPAWRRSGGRIESGPPAAGRPLPPYPLRPDPGRLADADLVARHRGAPDWLVLDARPEERYSGERETVDPVAGHIPGSVNRPWEDNLDFDGRFQNPDALRAGYLALLAGVSPERVIHSCGSGVTACHNLLAMEHAGLTGSLLYPGSWSEWIADPARPVALGSA